MSRAGLPGSKAKRTPGSSSVVLAERRRRFFAGLRLDVERGHVVEGVDGAVALAVLRFERDGGDEPDALAELGGLLAQLVLVEHAERRVGVELGLHRPHLLDGRAGEEERLLDRAGAVGVDLDDDLVLKAAGEADGDEEEGEERGGEAAHRSGGKGRREAE